MSYNIKRTFVLFHKYTGGIPTERTILHCDLNNFYASVACHDHPELRTKAVAVCGSVEMRHGIILAKNMAAKKMGVKTGEALWQAKEKCPDLVTVPPDFPRYSYFSKLAKEIYSEYSDLLESFGPDEAWIDVTGSETLFGSGRHIADELRCRVRKELGLTISVGVSFNKVFAKLGSDLRKPDATSVITKSNFKEVVWQLPIESMIGIGPSTAKKLRDIGIETLGQLARCDDVILKRRLGIRGPELKSYALGEDCSRVSPLYYKRKPQSIGRSTTYHRDITSNEDVWRLMLKLSEEVGAELRSEKLAATSVQIHLRTDSLKVNELQTPLAVPTQLGFQIAKAGFDLFKKSYDFLNPLRSVGIRAINLEPYCENARQLYLFENFQKQEKLQKIENQMDEIRGRFGNESIVRGRLLYEKTPPKVENAFSVIYK